MAVAQRIAHIGSWELDLTNANDIDANALRWSDEMFRIAGYEPGAVAVTNELFFSLIPRRKSDTQLHGWLGISRLTMREKLTRLALHPSRGDPDC